MSYLKIVKNECYQSVKLSSGRFASCIGQLRRVKEMQRISEERAVRTRNAKAQHSTLIGKLKNLQQRIQEVDNAMSYVNNFELKEPTSKGTFGIEEQLSHLKDVVNFALGESQ
ncbi:hypothetical protein [Bacillus bombysepticus]|uniref:hypothetical protein n=1 Tax=Bacillus bombysepticus TaxID=658666 RepID=UPI00301B1669